MEKTKSGSGLIFAVVLLFVILGMVVTLSSVTVLETKMNQKTKSSVGAFYNSESGVEWALNKIATNSSGQINTVFTMGSDGSTTPLSGSGYKVYLLDKDGKVINSSNTITPPGSDISLVKAVRAVGDQGAETQRAIEAAVATGGIGKYQISCLLVSGSPVCCRIDTEIGTTNCMLSNGSGWSLWGGNSNNPIVWP